MDGESEAKPQVEEENTAPDKEPMDTDTTHSEQTTPPTRTQGPVTKAIEEPSRVIENNDDDDVVLVEEALSPSFQAASTPTDCTEPHPSETETTAMINTTTPTAPAKIPSPPATYSAAPTEPIVIDDEEDPGHRGFSSQATAGGPSSDSEGILSSTEPDSEIKIASVTTLGPSVATAATAAEPMAEGDMNLVITSVTSLQGGVENGLQISSTFSLNPEAQSSISSNRLPTTFNPGRVSNTSTTSQPVQNGDTVTHQTPGNKHMIFTRMC